MISVWQLNREALDVAWHLLDKQKLVAQVRDDWRAGNYQLVADLLEATDLEEAWKLTNTVLHPWWQDARVTPRFAGHNCSGGCRSTNVGDVMVTDDGTMHVVCRVGFAPVDVLIPTVMTSWKPEVITDASGRWTANGLRFATEHEALAWARDLSFRWTLVQDYRAVESGDPVNYQYNTELAVLERIAEGEPV